MGGTLERFAGTAYVIREALARSWDHRAEQTLARIGPRTEGFASALVSAYLPPACLLPSGTIGGFGDFQVLWGADLQRLLLCPPQNAHYAAAVANCIPRYIPLSILFKALLRDHERNRYCFLPPDAVKTFAFLPKNSLLSSSFTLNDLDNLQTIPLCPLLLSSILSFASNLPHRSR